MLNFIDIDYRQLADISRRLQSLKVLPRSLSAEIVLALNLRPKSGSYGSYRELLKSNSLEDLALYAPNIPDYMNSTDAAKDLFISLLGELEDPFVYKITADYGGLRRAGVGNTIENLFFSADSVTEAAALVAAVLDAAVAIAEKKEEIITESPAHAG